MSLRGDITTAMNTSQGVFDQFIGYSKFNASFEMSQQGKEVADALVSSVIAFANNEQREVTADSSPMSVKGDRRYLVRGTYFEV